MTADNEAMILLGGLGTRLRAAVPDRPKPMALVAGKPFVTYLFEQLSGHGWDRAILCVGHMGTYIEQNFGNQYGALRLIYAFEKEPLGTAGALRNALELTTLTDILVMNGDSYCDLDIRALAQMHRAYEGAATLAVLEQNDRRRSGAVTVDADGRIVAFESRTQSPKAGLINAGVYMLRRDLLEKIPQDTKVSLEEDVFPGLARQGSLFAWRVEAPFIDIGTPESYQAAQSLFARDSYDDRRR
jgi:D-glycero-alpha-D-manno-heptose 1-phosphate guanylyltransferase